jgi:acyl dehydratase
LPVRTAAVGAAYPPRALRLEKRHLLSFAAGLDLPWDAALDDLCDGGLVGFPTYCASLEFNAFQEAAAAGANPLGLTADEQRRGVHATQDSTFHQPLRAGQRLTTSATVSALRRTRAGALAVVKAETRDASTGKPVVTSWISQVYRGVALDGPEAEAEAPPLAVAASDPGEPETRIEVPVSRALPHVYAECAGIWNPIHSEREAAAAAGLPDIILQGTATWSLAAREVVTRHADGDVGRLLRLTARFSQMVLVGERLIIELFPRQADVVPFQVLNASGAAVLKYGTAWLA